MVFTLLTAALFLSATGAAWFLAGEPEREGAKILVGILLIALVRRYWLGPIFGSIDLMGLGVDLMALFGFAWIALFAWRIWPLWAASLQLLAIASHVVRILEIEIYPLAYGLMRTGPTYFVCVALLIGSINNRKGVRTGASMPPWRSWSRRSLPKRPTG